MTDGPTTGPGPADLHTLTGAYALDAVDDLERRAVERHLAECDACREEVRGFRETAAALADGVALAPPAGLRERVLAEARTTAQLPPVQRGPSAGGAAPAGPDGATGPTVPADPTRPTRARPGSGPGGDVRHRAPARPGRLVAAAVAAVLALGGGTVGVVQYRAAQDLREQRQVALAQEREVAAVVGDPAARFVSGPVSSGGRVTVALASGRAVVLADGVPGLPADRTYQLWVVRPEGISSLGLGPAASAAAGGWARPVTGVRAGDTVAVSVEPSGGSRQPTTTPVAAVEL